MITISTSETIDLVEIENLKKWIEYMPECFVSNLAYKNFYDRFEEDRLILHSIDKLYSLIRKITGKEPDYANSRFDIGEVTLKQRDTLNKLKSNIPSLDIPTYANLKLTEGEKAFCRSFVARCSKDNSEEVAALIDSIPNFFLKSYAKYLLIHDPESDYIHSISNIGKFASGANKQLEKRFKVTEREEQLSWSKIGKRIY